MDLKLNEKTMWMAFGFAILAFLVITTPGWKEVLGFNFDIDLGKYAPVLIMLGFMGALVGFVLIGGGEKSE